MPAGNVDVPAVLARRLEKMAARTFSIMGRVRGSFGDHRRTPALQRIRVTMTCRRETDLISIWHVPGTQHDCSALHNAVNMEQNDGIEQDHMKLFLGETWTSRQAWRLHSLLPCRSPVEQTHVYTTDGSWKTSSDSSALAQCPNWQMQYLCVTELQHDSVAHVDIKQRLQAVVGMDEAKDTKQKRVAAPWALPVMMRIRLCRLNLLRFSASFRGDVASIASCTSCCILRSLCTLCGADCSSCFTAPAHAML